MVSTAVALGFSESAKITSKTNRKKNVNLPRSKYVALDSSTNSVGIVPTNEFGPVVRNAT